jgi:hypothetical protein
MDSLLFNRRIQIWNTICQKYDIPKNRFMILDSAIRAGEEIPPYRAPPSHRSKKGGQ